jgi:hypothetical protein
MMRVRMGLMLVTVLMGALAMTAIGLRVVMPLQELIKRL